VILKAKIGAFGGMMLKHYWEQLCHFLVGWATI
jgi:hypothetical protein